MLAVRTALLACLLVAACGGNPFPTNGNTPPPPPVTNNASVSTLPGTTTPSNLTSITRVEDKNKGPDGISVSGNGFAQD